MVASEFQCPFCKRVEPTLQALAQAFPGQVRFAWKHQPLAGHVHAIPAAVAAEEARAQGGDTKFWAMHDKLFELAPALDRPDLERAARELGLDVASVGAAVDQGRHMDRIRGDQAQLQALGVRATPTMFVNGRKVEGALPLEQLKPVVEEELRKAQSHRRLGRPGQGRLRPHHGEGRDEPRLPRRRLRSTRRRARGCPGRRAERPADPHHHRRQGSAAGR